jgi:uncharacterized repeat protein (TIGR03806 family)
LSGIKGFCVKKIVTLVVIQILALQTISRAQVPAPAASPLKLPAELPSATGYTTTDALPGVRFRGPLCIVTPPGETDRLFILEKDGTIQVVIGYGSAKPKKQVFLDVPAMLAAHNEGRIWTENEMGLLGLAFHPNYARNGLFYITYSLAIDEGGRKMFDRLSRFHVSANDPNKADPDSELPMITQVDRAPNHNGGDLHFGADGYLYYGVGDEGGGNDNFNNSRYIDKGFFAAIFRLDVDKKPGSLLPNRHQQDSTTYPSAVNPGTYSIPPDNPFVHATEHSGKKLDPQKIRTEIWCTGLRNPWRFWFDAPTGRMFIGDVGQGDWEEVDLGVAGGDYGWSYWEGTHRGPRNREMPAGYQTIPPIHEYPHGKSGDNCIIGGVVYRGTRLGELYGDYLFCDFGSRRVWKLRQDGDKWVRSTIIERDDDFASFGVDPHNGDVLLASLGAGKIKKLMRTGMQGEPPPALLSQTGAFTDTAALTPDPALVPYTPNVAFWSDYAVKTRWFVLPDASKKITFSKDGSWTFPTGTVFVKHFDMEMVRGDPTSKKRIETRFLVKTEDGIYGISYKWRADQTDADLVTETGQDKTLTIAVDDVPQQQVWHYPSRTECLTCHTSITGGVLGVNTRQMNGVAVYGQQKLNQIQALSDAGYFTQAVDDVKSLPAYVKADDKTQPLEARVRSYLAVNCVQCHQPGAGAVGIWDARPTTATADANLINGHLVNDAGDPTNRWMVPGDINHSMVFKRIRGMGVPRMPPLASNELDPSAAALLSEWIKKNK